jgi:four helix bundle protein
MDGHTLEKARQLQERTKQFAVRIVRMFQALPKTGEAQVIGKQVLRSGTGTAANYRAACRSRSKTEFAARMGVVVEEADETVFWLELLVEARIVSPRRMEGMLREANELLAIFSASRRTIRQGGHA